VLTSKLLLPAWIAAVALALVTIEAYRSTPGRAGTTPAHSVAAGRPRLLVFLHPRCPCSAATLGALQELLAERPGAADAEVYFVRPEEAAAGFEDTQLWKAANRIPAVQSQVDAGGRIAQRHGAETSGHILLYGARGELLFSGGITPGRGAAGASEGRRALAAALAGSARGPTTAPVFGCPLQTPVTGAR
jgi:hypothetical protein